MDMAKPLFPTPQQMDYHDGVAQLVCAGTMCCYIAIAADASADELTAAQLVRERIGAASGEWPQIKARGYPNAF